MKRSLLLLLCLCCASLLSAQEKALEITYETLSELPYYEPDKLAQANEYQKSQCRLDLYYPKDQPGFSTYIWLHGGGLTAGKRFLPDLKNQKIALVAVSYRLSPKVKSPAYLEDTAAATAWVLRHIAEYGGDPKRVFLGGHSAGGYLAAMVGMDPRWLAAEGLQNTDLAGLIPVSAQVTTHFNIRAERGDTTSKFIPVIDEFAPLQYAGGKVPPICLITGDRRIEYKARVEENEFLYASMRAMGNETVEFYELGGIDHETVTKPSAVVAKTFIKKIDGSAAAEAAAKAEAKARKARETGSVPVGPLEPGQGTSTPFLVP
jgi:acetyl esterase/lipase